MTDHQHDIEKYLKGELTSAERHALEKKALNDPFLADALEGAAQLDAEVFGNDVNELHDKIRERKSIWWMWPMRIAAGVTVLLVSTYLIWQTFETNPSQPIALQKHETITHQSSELDSTTSQQRSSQPNSSTSAGSTTSDQLSKKPAFVKEEEKLRQPALTEAIAELNTDKDDHNLKVELQTEEGKVGEPLAQAKPEEKEKSIVTAKTDEEQRSKKLSLASTDQKRESAPTSPRSKTASFSKVIKGKVTSAEDGSALPGINIIIKGTTLGTVTDVAGNYQIEVSQSNTTLVYSFIGLKTTEVNAGDGTEINVSLSVDATELSEVVVTALGVESGNDTPLVPVISLAHPSIGYKAFKHYLLQNMRYPEEAKQNKVEGRVTVEFTIKTNGTLSNFSIIRSVGSGCDDELIRLIKEGPAWIPTTKEDVPIEDKVRVRLKFELPK